MTSMRKLLIVSPHFPPTNAADIHRVRLSLSHYREFGWDPVVLAVDPRHVEGAEEPLLVEALAGDVPVHRVAAAPVRWTRRFGFGDLGYRALPYLYREGARMIRRYDPHLVYFSTTMFSTMMLGRLWKRRYGIPFVLDMQDPWVNDYYENQLPSNRPPKYHLAQRVNRILEPWTMREVAGLTAVSKQYIDTLREHYPWIAEPVCATIPFGADTADSEVAERLNGEHVPFDRKDGMIHGVYAGRLGVDMRPACEVICRALQMGLERSPELFARVRMHFIGTNYAQGNRAQPTIRPIAERMGLTEYIEERPHRVAYFSALASLRSGDFIIVPGSDDLRYSASKIFSYILMRRPMVAVFHEASSTVRVLRDTRAGDVVTFRSPPDVESTAKALLEAWRNVLERIPYEPSTDWEAFEPFTARELTRRQCRLFDRAVEGTSKGAIATTDDSMAAASQPVAGGEEVGVGLAGTSAELLPGEPLPTGGAPDAVPEASAPLGERARQAVVWNAAFTVFSDLLQFSVMLVMVRLIAREAYGQLALVQSLMQFIHVLSLQTFLNHVFQVRREEDVHYQDHFTFGLAVQVGMVVLTNLVAGALWFTEGYAAVALPVHVMSVLFVLQWPCDLCQAMMQRELDWKRTRLLHALGLILTAVASISMAWAGAEVYALLIPGLLVNLPFIWELFVKRRWRPTWQFDWKRYRAAWRFGVVRIGSGLLTTGRLLLASGMIKYYIGFAKLGVFNRALSMGTIFCTRIATHLMIALYPVLTRIKPCTDQYRRVSALILRLVAWAVVPIAGMFVVLAAPVVHVVYGQRWVEVIPLLPWAMAQAAIASLAHVAYRLLLSHERQRLCFWLDQFGLAGTAALLFSLLRFGVKSYLIGVAALDGILLTATLAMLVRDRAITLRGIVWAFVPSAFATGVAWSVCELVSRQTGFAATGFVTGVLYGACFATLYVLILRVGFRTQFRELITYLPVRDRLYRFFRLAPE